MRDGTAGFYCAPVRVDRGMLYWGKLLLREDNRVIVDEYQGRYGNGDRSYVQMNRRMPATSRKHLASTVHHQGRGAHTAALGLCPEANQSAALNATWRRSVTMN